MGEVIEGAVQHAPHAVRQSMGLMLSAASGQSIMTLGEVAIMTIIRILGLMTKSLIFGVMHLGIAFTVSYALIGSVAIAGAITLVEPLVNTVAHYFLDRWRERRSGLQRMGAAP